MKKLQLNQMENLEGGKFWGWLHFAEISPCLNGWIFTVSEYYVLGFVVDTEIHRYPC